VIEMGFLDKLRKKNVGPNETQTQAMGTSSQQQTSSASGTSARRIKKYTSEGKPVYD
jgi:hypothetical protein